MSVKLYNIEEKNKDLKKHIFLWKFKKILFYILWITVWLYSYWFYSNNYDEIGIFSQLLLFIAVLVSGFILFGIGKLIRLKNFRGKIISKNIIRDYSYARTQTNKKAFDYHMFVKFEVAVKGEKNKKIKLAITDENLSSYYPEGTEIIYRKGLDYPLCVESEKQGKSICSVCGATYHTTNDSKYDERDYFLNQKGDMRCERCCYSIMKIDSSKRD